MNPISHQLAHMNNERKLHNHANRVWAAVLWAAVLFTLIGIFSYLSWVAIHHGAKGSTALIVIIGGAQFAVTCFALVKAIDDLKPHRVDRRHG